MVADFYLLLMSLLETGYIKQHKAGVAAVLLYRKNLL